MLNIWSTTRYCLSISVSGILLGEIDNLFPHFNRGGGIRVFYPPADSPERIGCEPPLKTLLPTQVLGNMNRLASRISNWGENVTRGIFKKMSEHGSRRALTGIAAKNIYRQGFAVIAGELLLLGERCDYAFGEFDCGYKLGI